MLWLQGLRIACLLEVSESPQEDTGNSFSYLVSFEHSQKLPAAERYSLPRGKVSPHLNRHVRFHFYFMIKELRSTWLLAHLSRRLTRWAYSIAMVRRPSIVVRRRRPYFQTWISLKPVGQPRSNFICSITGVGERLHKVLGQIGSNSGFHGNRKPPLTYNG